MQGGGLAATDFYRWQPPEKGTAQGAASVRNRRWAMLTQAHNECRWQGCRQTGLGRADI
ncbi:hypothetical protein ACQV2E_01400 [Pantoea allii]|uniref:hypothetical protein n=1 Tax=Pantoea allii TaxID=574096 RepID=UPI003D30FE9B